MKMSEEALVISCIDYVTTEEMTPESLEALVTDMFRANKTPIERIPKDAIKKSCEDFCRSLGRDSGVEDIGKIINFVSRHLTIAERLDDLFGMFGGKQAQ